LKKIPEPFTQYLITKLIGRDLKGDFIDDRLIKYAVSEIICNEDRPLWTPDEDSICTRTDCIEYVDEFLKQSSFWRWLRNDRSR